MPQIIRLAKSDAEYQELLALCRCAEEEYKNILNSLEEDQQKNFENYICLCEELNFRLAQLAYECGKCDKVVTNRTYLTSRT